MAENFYLDNPDLRFHLNHVDLSEAVASRERGYAETAEFPEAPSSYEEAVATYDAVLTMVGEISAQRIAPEAAGVDREGARFEGGQVHYAQGTRRSLDDLGAAQLFGVTLPRRFGGLNFPSTIYQMMSELVSRADASLHNLVGLQEIGETILKFGSEEQKQRYLPRLASGQADGAMALTEAGAGSDLQAVRTVAWQDGSGQWFLRGTKQFITNGCAQVSLVLARSEEGSTDGRGLSMFICEKGPRVRVRRIEEKLGLHGSPTCEVEYDDAPAELVGSRRRGLTRYVMSLMNGARVAVGAQSVGIAEAALRSALEYARSRRQFGRTIDQFPAVYEMLVGARVQTAAARAVLYEATRWVDQRDALAERVEAGDAEPGLRERAKYADRVAALLTPLAKAYTSEVANQVTFASLQVHGGSGYMRDYSVERLCRDARVTNIYEGTTQLQHVAALGGVTQRVLEPLYDQWAGLAAPGPLAAAAAAGREALGRAVAALAERKDPELLDLAARRLCDAEVAVLASHLLLRDVARDPGREALAERYLTDVLAPAVAAAQAVATGDRALIERREELLSL